MTPREPGPLLLMAQIDDAPGELLGHVVDELGRLGARNVQLLSSLGKKGRPGYVLLVDVDAADEQDAAALLVGELGVWGYRVLESRHEHFDIRRYTTTLEVRRGGRAEAFPLRLKRILRAETFLRAKAEHDDLVAVCARLDPRVALAVLKSAVETAVGADEPGEVLTVELPNVPTGPQPGRP